MTKLDPSPHNQLEPLTGYRPNPEQLDRAMAARRFTRLYVYLPLGVFTAIVGLLIFYLLYLALFPPDENTYLYLSGLADFVLIMFLIPVVLLIGIFLFGGIGGYLYYKYGLDEAERPLPPAPPYGRIRTLLWRVDDLLLRMMPKVDTAVNQISQPVIKFNGLLAYIASWISSVKNLLLRR